MGTCGIGRVLDADLKVLGFQNLRVVDASAIPEMPPNSGPAASVYLLAEHISDAIIDNAGAASFAYCAQPSVKHHVAASLIQIGAQEETMSAQTNFHLSVRA